MRELFQGSLHGESSRLLPRRKIFKRLDVLRHDRLRWNQDKDVIDKPFDVVAGFVFGPLEWVRPEIEQFWRTQRLERLEPDLQAMGGLSAPTAVIGRSEGMADKGEQLFRDGRND